MKTKEEELIIVFYSFLCTWLVQRYKNPLTVTCKICKLNMITAYFRICAKSLSLHYAVYIHIYPNLIVVVFPAFQRKFQTE